MAFTDSLSINNFKLVGFQRLFLLLALNLIPLLGVIFFEWDIFTVILLFWLENAVIGIFNCLKIVGCKGSKSGKPQVKAWHANLGMAFFFLVHYGFFTTGHGLVILDIFVKDFKGDIWQVWSWVYHWLGAIDGVLWLGVIALVGYWLFDFIQFWLHERQTKNANKQMMEPYSRILIAHLVLLFGAFVVSRFGYELAIVALMVVVKTFINYQDALKKQTKTAENLK